MTIPSVPVDASTAVEKKVVNPASPLVVDAGTKVGPPPTPPLPLKVVVLSPEIMVVYPFPMIVVIMTEVMVLPSMTTVAGCSRVRVIVAEQAHEVS